MVNVAGSGALRLPGGGEWSVWPWAAVRSSGFPAVLVDALADSGVAAAGRALIAARADHSRARAAADAALSASVDATDEPRTARHRLKLLMRVRHGKAVPDQEDPRLPRTELDRLREATERVEQVEQQLAAAYDTAEETVGRQLVEVVADPRFQEAVIWQNRSAYETALRSLLSTEPGRRDSRTRQREQWAALHLQRYAMKNDTIGFFGPLGWAELTDAAESLSVLPGPQFLRRRHVHLEQWAVDRLARRLGRQDGVRSAMHPRRRASVSVANGMLHRQSGPPAPLSPAMAEMLKACDGTRSATALADALVATGDFASLAEAMECLETLHDRSLIGWQFELPVTPDADRDLARQLAEIADDAARESATQSLTRLTRARDAVGAAAGAPERLFDAIGRLESVFNELTGDDSVRRAGKMYAGRTLVYEECLRDVDVRLGAEVLAEMGPPIGLLLQLGRWCGVRYVQLVEAATRDIFSALVGEHADGQVPVGEIWARAGHVFPEFLPWSGHDAEPSPSERLQAEMQQRWTSCLPEFDENDRMLELSSVELLPRVLAAFPADAPGWSDGRYHSPDLLISAASAEHVARGEYDLVLGEMHWGSSTLSAGLFVGNHPDPARLQAQLQHDLADPVVHFVPSRHWPGSTTMLRPALVKPDDWYLLLSDDLPDGVPSNSPRLLSLAELIFVEQDGELVVRSRDGRFRANLPEFFSSPQQMALIKIGTQLLFPGRHRPRVMLDRLVLQREGWTIALDELPADDLDRRDGYVEVLAWAERTGLPRYCFYRLETEVKPIYLDLHSPLLVSVFSRAVRRARLEGASEVAVTEMLPNRDHVWLRDFSGERFNAELRFCCVDESGRIAGSGS